MQDVNMFHRSQVSSILSFLMRMQVKEFGEESGSDITIVETRKERKTKVHTFAG